MQPRIIFCVLLGVFAAISLEVKAQENKWKEFTSEEDGFVVSLPTDPSVISKDNMYNFGKVTIKAYTSNPKQGVGWRIATHNYPEPFASQVKPERLIELMRDDMSKNVKSKAEDIKEVKLDGYPGEEFVVHSPDPLTKKPLTNKTRLFAVKGKVYQLTVIAPKDDAVLGDVASRFFTSFKLSKKKDQ
jgi:hypothetical protein